MPTKTSKSQQFGFKTLVEDPNTGEHIQIKTTVKYPGEKTKRVKEIEAQVARAHTIIDEMDQASLDLKDKEVAK